MENLSFFTPSQKTTEERKDIEILSKRIVVKLLGGLGNQIWQYIAALALYSRHTGIAEEPEIWLHQTGNRPFELDKLFANLRICQKTPKGLLPYQEPNQFQFDDDFLNLPTEIVLEGYFQHYRYFELAKPYLNIQLLPIAAKYQQLQQKYQLVALHVRRGDYLIKENMSRHPCISVGYYRSALESICCQIGKTSQERQPYILVFSDDLAYCKQAIEPLLKNLELAYDYPAGNTLEDFSLIAHCKHFIIANSSYSLLGALLGQQKDSVVIMPQIWLFPTNTKPHQFLPLDWQVVYSRYERKPEPKVDPKVSVIIPVYNTEEYLIRCLESVYNQTEENIEIIIVDDASPDNSWELIEQYAAKDQRIVAIRHEQNKHLGGARNTGIKAATAEWLLFVDSDDYIAPNMVEIFLNKVLQYPDIRLFTCQHTIVHEAGSFNDSHHINSVNSDTIIENPFEVYCTGGEHRVNIYNCAWAKLWQRRLFIENNIYFPEGISAEDMAVTPQLLYKLEKLLYIPQSMYYYYMRSGSLTNQYSEKSVKDFAQASGILYKELGSHRILVSAYQEIFDWFYHHVLSYGLASIPKEQKEQELLDRLNLLCTELYTYDVSILSGLLQDWFTISTMKNDRWYRFGQLSNKRKVGIVAKVLKRKVWVIAKVLSKKLKIYPLLKPLVNQYRRFMKS